MANDALAHRFRLAVLLPILAAPVCARASNVTACHSDTETGKGTNLSQALAIGGDVFIRCPSGSKLQITKSYRISVPTQIIGSPTDSGSSRIILNGTGAQGPLLHVMSGHLTVQNLEISGFTRTVIFLKEPVGVIPGSAGPIWGTHEASLRAETVIKSHADVELDNVWIDNNVNPVGVSGNLTVKNCGFRNNSGNTLVANGTVMIDNSTFSQNERGVLLDAGSITYSVFYDNTVLAVDILFPSGQVTLRDSTFSTNGGVAVAVSAQSSPNGGGSVLLRNDTFSGNSSAQGALTITTESLPPPIPVTDSGNVYLANLPAGNIQVLYSHFLSNIGLAGAVLATLRDRDELDLGGDDFLTNHSTQPDAAALRLAGGTATISHSLFKANVGVQTSAIAAGATTRVTMSNSLVVENTSTGSSAGHAAAITATNIALSNVTIANNQQTGIHLSASAANVAKGVFSNVIIVGNTRSCEFGAGLSLAGSNLVFPDDHGCPGATIIEDPVLDSFYVPSPGSPALAQGDPKVCAAAPVSARDIVFQKRTDSTCALGAFERPPPRFVVKPTPDALAQLGRAGQEP